MSIHTAATHTRRDDTTAHLRFAYDFVTHSGLEAQLGHTVADNIFPSPRRGRPRQYMAYTATTIVCVIYELVASNRPYTIKEIVDAIWHRYTEDHLRLIGLGGMRDAARKAQMTVPPNAKPEQKLAAERVEYAEYQRAWQTISKLFTAMDDTPLVANHGRPGTGGRPTRRQVAEAARNPELRLKTAVKDKIVNALIGSGLHVQNDKLRPGTTLHGPGGVLEDHEGHLAFDETHLAASAWGVLDAETAPGNYMARVHAHSKIYRGAPALIGLTLGVTVPRPAQTHDVPTLCLGAALHHPTGGLGSAVLEILDAIEANNLRAPRRSNRNQQLIFDAGYTESVGLNRGATQRGYGIVIRYKKGQRTLHEIQSAQHDDGTVTPGFRLYNGRPLCPGASMAVLTRTKLTVPEVTDRKKDKGPNPLSGPELVARLRKLANILPFVMATSGRPQEVADNKRGGQSKTRTGREPVMRVTLTCPKIKGTARCAIFSDFHDLDQSHLPAVPAPPVELPFHQRPTCCNNETGTMQARIPLAEFKDWQEFMPGTWEHFDWYSGPRSANERYNARLKHATGGSNLNRNAIAARKAAPYALFTAMAIVNANRLAVESWDRNLAVRAERLERLPAKKSPSHKPSPKARENKINRAQILKTYLAGLSRGHRHHADLDANAELDVHDTYAEPHEPDEKTSDR